MIFGSEDPVLHWYDLTCPFCYVGQSRNALFARAGMEVTSLPFQAHPGIPPGGLLVGPRSGPMYSVIANEAHQAGLELRWPERLPDSRRALAAVEWVRRHEPDHFDAVQHAFFTSHFVLGDDISDPDVIDRIVITAEADSSAVSKALADGSAYAAVSRSEQTARSFGVTGTPAWKVADVLIVGLQPLDEFDRVIGRHTAGDYCG